MNKRNHVLAGLLAASFAAIALPSYAEVYINIDPPSRRAEHYEVREGYVWVPGAWHWQNNKHQWNEGHYVKERKGYRYESDRWVKHSNDKWVMQKGGWARDSDGDGTPDNKDRAPNNPNRQ
jgi:hypothetical protein